MRTLVLFGLLVAAPVAVGAQTADEGNGATRLLRDVAHDYKNFLSLDTAEVLGVGGFAAGAIHAADSSIAEHVQTHDSTNLVGGSEYGSQYFQVPLAITWWAVGAAAGSDRHAAAGRDLLRAQLSVVSWTYAIKLAAESHASERRSARVSIGPCLELVRHRHRAPAPLRLEAGAAGVSHRRLHLDLPCPGQPALVQRRRVRRRGRHRLGANRHASHSRSRVSIAPLAVPGGGGVLIAAVR